MTDPHSHDMAKAIIIDRLWPAAANAALELLANYPDLPSTPEGFDEFMAGLLATARAVEPRPEAA